MAVRDGKVKLGIVGAGFMGQIAHLANYAQIPDCEIIGLAEPREELRRRVAERYGIPNTYATNRELLENDEIEAVVVVTARPMMAPAAFDCLTAGRHCLTEKPMAGTYEQASRLVEAAAAKDLVYAVGFMKRYDAGLQWAKAKLSELIDSRALGSITFVRMHGYQGDAYYNASGDIRTDEIVPDDLPTWPMAPDWLDEERQIHHHVYINRYSHYINMLRYLFGGSPGVEYFRYDSLAAQLAVFDFGDFTASLETGDFKFHAFDELLEIYFEFGCMKIEFPAPLNGNTPASVRLYISPDGERQDPELIVPQFDWSWSFKRQAEAFIAAVSGGDPILAPGADAMEDLRIVEDMWRSLPQ